MQKLIVRGAPQEYECRTNAWQGLAEHLHKRKLKTILVLHGTASWLAAKPYFPNLDEFTLYFMDYGGECTDQKSSAAAAFCRTNQIEAIVAVGGGKVADLGKSCANQTKLPIIILPTLAATCAACTPLSVMYNNDGSMDRYDVYGQANALVLVEPEVILHSPIDLMIAGIGDTLAKWYEAQPMIEQLTYQPIEIQVAEFAAKKSRDILLADSYQALNAMKTKTINEAFLNVLETNILLAGMVGGFGDDYGRTSGAHSIHDALTLIDGSHQQLHGNKVAYAILVQLVIEKKLDEIQRLLPFYHQLNLPTSLKQMNLTLSEEEYQMVAARTARPDENIHFLKETISPNVVYHAMKQLERMTA